MKKISIVIILVILFNAGNVFSQENSTEKLNYSKTTNLNSYIKLSPFSLLEIEPSLLIGYSYPVKKGKAQWQHEIGYVFLNDAYFLSFDNDDRIAFNGLKIRNNYRTYFDSNLKKADSLKNQNNRLYFGVDFMYKYCQYTEYDVSIWRMSQFNQIMDITNEKHIGAFHFLLGVESNFIKDNNALLDFYLGLGVRYKTINTKFDGAKNSSLESDFGNSNHLWYDDMDIPMNVSIMAGMKIGFGL